MKINKWVIPVGLAWLTLFQTNQVVAVEGGVQYRIAWDAAAERYRVYMRPTTTPVPDLSMTAQVTLRVPHATGQDKFTVTDLQVKPKTSWSLSSEVPAPKEDSSVDYLSFTYTPIEVKAFAFAAGVEQEVFSFKNSGACLGSVTLMDNANDPFNQPPDEPKNSAGTNPGNQFANAGWGTTDDNDYLGNYGTAANCQSDAPTQNTPPVAQRDYATTGQGKAITIDVLANDTDAEGNILSLSSFTQGTHGSVTQVDDKLIYTPAAGFSGTDTFTYVVSDGTDQTTATVTITVEKNIPTAPDNDKDGISDADEKRLGTDPNNPDTDGDGVSDGVEVGADISKPLDTDGDGSIDPLDNDDDGDGILTQYELGTFAKWRYTDGDGVPDYRDADDNHDGISTREQHPDLNGDNNPSDA
ncbi:MAG: Ig-like domain-containing protein, partial [Thiothrix sp.]